ncbi:MAG: aminotransferase class III-fold pyridoxal phosphate-dependent enzyme, partial [Eubacteriaceae bacterium]|nr:aminotransferase class III-fold pyridoxal phosphate-dependent enzyme [Eubacteriaceae bacterium]
VQCGIGRSGHFFAYQHYNLKPDIVAFAKGVAGGVPMGGIIANNKVASAFTPGTHASTFGANPLATAASCYVLKKIGDPAFLKNVSEMGLYLRNGLEKLRSSCTQIVDIRGMGLMLGIEIKGDVGQIVNQAMNMGLLIVGAGNATIRLVPPLIVTKDEIDQAIFILKSCIH